MAYFKIELDNVSHSFFAGEVITGLVIVENKSSTPFIIEEVTVLLEGRYYVLWATSSLTRFKSGKHVSKKTCLVAYWGNSTWIPENGRTAFPFQIVIPENIPSSFTSEHGNISYYLEAELQTLLLVLKGRAVLPLNVIAKVDLNTTVGALHPKYLTKVKGANTLVGRHGQIEFVLHLPRYGFIVGEILELSCKVTNSSNKNVTGMKASLNQVATFYVKTHSKRETKEVCCVLGGPEVKAGDYIWWIPRGMTIPQVPPTWTDNHLIDIQYLLHFQLSISGLSADMTGDIPIIIGTIPFRSDFDQFQRQPSENLTELPPPSYLSATSPAGDIELDLPTYDEAVFGPFLD